MKNTKETKLTEMQNGLDLTIHTLVEILDNEFKVPLKSRREKKLYYVELYNNYINNNPNTFILLPEKHSEKKGESQIHSSIESTTLISKKRNRDEDINDSQNISQSGGSSKKILINSDPLKNQYNIIKTQTIKMANASNKDEGKGKAKVGSSAKEKVNAYIESVVNNASSNAAKEGNEDYYLDEHLINKEKFRELERQNEINNRNNNIDNNSTNNIVKGQDLKSYKDILNDINNSNINQDGENNNNNLNNINNNNNMNIDNSETPDFDYINTNNSRMNSSNLLTFGKDRGSKKTFTSENEKDRTYTFGGDQSSKEDINPKPKVSYSKIPIPINLNNTQARNSQDLSGIQRQTSSTNNLRYSQTQVLPQQVIQTPQQTTPRVSNTNLLQPRRSSSDINLVYLGEYNSKSKNNTDNKSIDGDNNENKSVDRVLLRQYPFNRSLSTNNSKLNTIMQEINPSPRMRPTSTLSLNNLRGPLPDFRRRNLQLNNNISEVKIPNLPLLKRIKDVFKNFIDRIKRNEDNINYLLTYLIAALAATGVILTSKKYFDTHNKEEFLNDVYDSLIKLGNFLKDHMAAFFLATIIVIAFLAFLDLIITPSAPLSLEKDDMSVSHINIPSRSQSRTNVAFNYNQEMMINYYNYIKNELKFNYNLAGLQHIDIIDLLIANGLSAEAAGEILPKIIEMLNNDNEIKCFPIGSNLDVIEKVWKFIGDIDMV